MVTFVIEGGVHGNLWFIIEGEYMVTFVIEGGVHGNLYNDL